MSKNQRRNDSLMSFGGGVPPGIMEGGDLMFSRNSSLWPTGPGNPKQEGNGHQHYDQHQNKK